MTGLPDSYHSAVGLDLIDVTTFHPDILSRVHRRRNDRRSDDRRSNDRWRGDDRRDGSCNNPIGDYAADDTAHESRPEIPAAASPGAAMTMAMHGTRYMMMAMHGTRYMMMADDTAMTASRPAMPPCECRSCAKRDCDANCCDFNHFIHIAPSLSPHLAVTIR